MGAHPARRRSASHEDPELRERITDPKPPTSCTRTPHSAPEQTGAPRTNEPDFLTRLAHVERQFEQRSGQKSGGSLATQGPPKADVPRRPATDEP